MEYRFTFDELAQYVIAANIIVGILFGSFPLIAGIMAKDRKYALFGFFGSIVGGAILGVFLSYPVAAIFVWLILRRSRISLPAANVIADSEPASETTLI